MELLGSDQRYPDETDLEWTQLSEEKTLITHGQERREKGCLGTC